MEEGVDGGHHVLEGAGVGPGDGHDHQVGSLADLLQDGTDDLADGLAGHRVTGEGAGERRRAHVPDGANRMSSERR